MNYDISLRQQKHSKFKRMRGCNCSVIIENGSFIKWVATTGTVN